MAVAILHILQRPPSGATTSAAAAAPGLPREAADQLAAAEVALLERHLARVLTCSVSELLASGMLPYAQYARALTLELGTLNVLIIRDK